MHVEGNLCRRCASVKIQYYKEDLGEGEDEETEAVKKMVERTEQQRAEEQEFYEAKKEVQKAETEGRETERTRLCKYKFRDGWHERSCK